MRSDDDGAMHDHPWPSESVILRGGYWEIEPYDQGQSSDLDGQRFKRTWKGPGAYTCRKAGDRHRLEVEPGVKAWTLFTMGAYEQHWGFYTPEGKQYWREYLNDWVTSTTTDKAE